MYSRLNGSLVIGRVCESASLGHNTETCVVFWGVQGLYNELPWSLVLSDGGNCILLEYVYVVLP